MRVHHKTTTAEFIENLRYVAIKAGQTPQFIDRLIAAEDLEADLEKAGDQLSEMEKNRDDLYDELEAFVKVVDENLDPDASKAIENALKSARDTLERHADNHVPT